jgi:hypothetical protein
MRFIVGLLGDDAQDVLDWAKKEALRTRDERGQEEFSLGGVIFDLVAREAAIRLVQENTSRGRLTTKGEIKKKTGFHAEMPVLYRDAGLRHPQEARNLRHNMFHESFMTFLRKRLPDAATRVPATGDGLTPDLIVSHSDPDWTIAVEYKGYRSLTLLSESELLKGMRYQAEWGSAWLVTTSSKSVRNLYGDVLRSKDLVERGLDRLRAISKRKAFTPEQKENRGIARKGIMHLQKHEDENLRCNLISAEELLESCRIGRPVKGLAVSTGLEMVDIMKREGLNEAAETMLRIMKSPTDTLHSDSVTSFRLIE